LRVTSRGLGDVYKRQAQSEAGEGGTLEEGTTVKFRH
jgi:hypothetical protein